MHPYTLELTERNILTVRIENANTSDWEQWFLLSSDRHHDNLLTNWNLEKRHLEKAKERGALILDFGDMFCAMQGKYDPRSDMSQIRQEHVGVDYLDRLVRTAADFYGPYAENWAMIGYGNHETNVLRRHGTDLISNLVHRLRSGGSNCQPGGYGGWVRVMVTVNKTKRASVNIKYHHGSGGGGPVTRGVIQTNRQAVYLPDADIVANGHTHDSWIVPIARERLSDLGRVRRDLVWFVRTPGYKDDYSDGAEGFHVERWGPPKPLGCIWLRLTARAEPFGLVTEMIQDIE